MARAPSSAGRAREGSIPVREAAKPRSIQVTSSDEQQAVAG
jgi:hypothetical protein